MYFNLSKHNNSLIPKHPTPSTIHIDHIKCSTLGRGTKRCAKKIKNFVWGLAKRCAKNKKFVRGLYKYTSAFAGPAPSPRLTCYVRSTIVLCIAHSRVTHYYLLACYALLFSELLRDMLLYIVRKSVIDRAIPHTIPTPFPHLTPPPTSRNAFPLSWN